MASRTSNFGAPLGTNTEKQRYFPFGTGCALKAAWVRWSDPTKKRDLAMFATFTSAREAATVIAGAFVSALLLVSAATSLPIA
jgi:hypothetical protein